MQMTFHNCTCRHFSVPFFAGFFVVITAQGASVYGWMDALDEVLCGLIAFGAAAGKPRRAFPPGVPTEPKKTEAAEAERLAPETAEETRSSE